MRHRRKVKKLNRAPQHRKLLVAGLLKDLLRYGKVDTTVARAKASAPLAERLITWAKQDDTHHRRLAFRVLQDKALVKKLFEEIGPRYQDRSGGYTRVLKLPPRPGDGAEMARLTLVEAEPQG